MLRFRLCLSAESRRRHSLVRASTTVLQTYRGLLPPFSTTMIPFSTSAFPAKREILSSMSFLPQSGPHASLGKLSTPSFSGEVDSRKWRQCEQHRRSRCSRHSSILMLPSTTSASASAAGRQVFESQRNHGWTSLITSPSCCSTVTSLIWNDSDASSIWRYRT